VREYQNVAPNQQQIVEPTPLDRPPAEDKQEDEEENGEKEFVAGEQHTDKLHLHGKNTKNVSLHTEINNLCEASDSSGCHLTGANLVDSCHRYLF
jgi:hypothetical protein